MKFFTQKHDEALSKLEQLKTTIECTGDVCKRYPVIPQCVYDMWVSTINEEFKYDTIETRQLAQKRFNVLCNLLFENKGDYLVNASSVHNNGMVYIENDKLMTDFSKLDVTNITGEHKNTFFVIRNYLSDTSSPKVVLDATNLSLKTIWNYYTTATDEQNIISYLLVETFEKKATIVLNTGSRFKYMLAKLILRVFDEQLQYKITIS